MLGQEPIANTPFPAPPRMEDVAIRAGVSLGTVSNVLNRPALVSAKTLSKVQNVIDELGFIPNRAARALAAGTNNTIGFVVADLSNSFFVDMIRGAEEEATVASMKVLLANTDMQMEKQRSYLDLFAEERLEGVLLAPLPGTAPMVRDAHPNRHIVMLNDTAVAGACTVSVNNELGGYLAARHLIEIGRRRLLFAGDPALAEPVLHRLQGAERAVSETSGVTMEVARTPEVQVDDGRKLGHELLARSACDRPDGIVAAADLLALGVMQAFRSDPTLRIPEDVAITGYDDNRSAWSSMIPITTLAQPGGEMGRTAVGLLLDEIKVGATHEHRHVVMDPQLIVRASTVRPIT